MAKSDDYPGLTRKRKILFSPKTQPEKMLATGQQFMEAGRYDDALEFFQRAEAHDLTRRIAEDAMQAGNTPLYMRAKKVLGEDISEDEWNTLAETAERAGMFSAAWLAHSQAGHAEEAARLRDRMAGPEAPEQNDNAHDRE
jgi:hypothetical protein